MGSPRAETPRYIDHYRILRLLGRGGMGEVYLAWSGLRLVALKLLLPHFADDPASVELFLAEARLSGKLNDTHIAHVFGVGRDGGYLYMVMEYVPGWSLDRLIDHPAIPGRSLFPWRIGVTMFASLAGALSCAHLAGVAHRDLSPRNILITETGVPKLIDFGIARAWQLDPATTPGTLKGQFGYMAPEYVLGQACDHRVDLFALGVVMWEVFARRRLYPGTAASQLLAAVQQPAPGLETVDPTVPRELAAIVARLLERDPALRYAHADDVARDLEQVGRALSDAPREPEEPRTLAQLLTRYLGDELEARAQLDREAQAAMDREPQPATDRAAPVAGDEAATRGARRPNDELAADAPLPPVETAARLAHAAAEGPTPQPSLHARSARRSGWRLGAAIGSLVLCGVAAALVVPARPERGTPEPSVVQAPSAATAEAARGVDVAPAPSPALREEHPALARVEPAPIQPPQIQPPLARLASTPRPGRPAPVTAGHAKRVAAAPAVTHREPPAAATGPARTTPVEPAAPVHAAAGPPPSIAPAPAAVPVAPAAPAAPAVVAPPPPTIPATPRVTLAMGGDAGRGAAVVASCNRCHAEVGARAIAGPSRTRAQWERFFARGTHDRYRRLGDQLSAGDAAAAATYLAQRSADASEDLSAGIR